MGQARRKQSLGDFTGSLQLVEQVLSANPDHVEARRYLTENTSRLLEMYRSRIGKLSSRPRLKLRPQEIIWQSLDHRAGFLVSQVDGQTTYEEIIEISGLSELEATRILARLVDQGVIG
jgi:CRP-like cAMP-binding protein